MTRNVRDREVRVEDAQIALRAAEQDLQKERARLTDYEQQLMDKEALLVRIQNGD
jgi:Tfp pilus assembly protein PilX